MMQRHRHAHFAQPAPFNLLHGITLENGITGIKQGIFKPRRIMQIFIQHVGVFFLLCAGITCRSDAPFQRLNGKAALAQFGKKVGVLFFHIKGQVSLCCKITAFGIT